jgi:hypothetical protein
LPRTAGPVGNEAEGQTFLGGVAKKVDRLAQGDARSGDAGDDSFLARAWTPALHVWGHVVVFLLLKSLLFIGGQKSCLGQLEVTIAKEAASGDAGVTFKEGEVLPESTGPASASLWVSIGAASHSCSTPRRLVKC